MIAILMSTYNGALYLSEQLDSLISQSVPDWRLYVRDDGSHDSTRDILRKYASSDPRICFLEEDKQHRGCLGSYLWLMQQADADVYMFCDHDDVWFPDKLKSTIDLMPSDRSIPSMAATDMIVTDNRLNVINKSMWKGRGIDRIVMRPQFLCITPLYSGCTMAFSRGLRDEVLKNPPGADAEVMPDHLVQLMALRCRGVIRILPRPTLFYRQHSGNISGFGAQKSIGYKFSHILKVLRDNRFCYRMAHNYGGVGIFRFIYYKFRSLLRM